jgi:hypothetical protein
MWMRGWLWISEDSSPRQFRAKTQADLQKMSVSQNV